MSSGAPNAIITNQYKAIQGIVVSLYELSLSFCLWHIIRQLPENFQALAQYKLVKKFLKSIIYRSLKIQEFKEIWIKIIKDYNLEEN